MTNNIIDNNLISNIKTLIINSRNKIISNINNELLLTYWEIGKEIVEFEQKGKNRAEYGTVLIKNISKELTNELGKGFSRANIQNMRLIYLKYPICQTLSSKLSWSHYCELLYIEDDNERSFYEKETINSNWSVRELKKQKDKALYQRLLLTNGDLNKQKVLKLARDGQIIKTPKDIIKDPYIFEFLGIPENKPILEKELEKRLIKYLEKFLLELGKGFMFVGSQQRITIGNIHHYVDIVFYNKILKSYVLIDLKINDLKIENAGQMNAYLNFYKNEVNDENDNLPIGIILCANKNDVVAEYALGGLENKIFVSKYKYYLPNKEQLEMKIQQLLKEKRVN